MGFGGVARRQGRNWPARLGCGWRIGYARVSTDEQAREGVSLEVQQQRIRAYAEAKELELAEVPNTITGR